MGMKSVRLLTLLMVGMGMIVGTVDIVSVAYAREWGYPAAASLILAAYAIGSCLAGLLFGSFRLKTPLIRLLWLGAGNRSHHGSSDPCHPPQRIDPRRAGGRPLFAPTMIVAMSLVERQVGEHQLTEGMTWLLAGLNVGVALGAAIAGQVVDNSGARFGFSVALCAGVTVLLIAFLSHLTLRRQDNCA
jgi:hypothetical protein